MKVISTKILGCYEIQPIIINDNRGKFIKTFHKEVFASSHLETHFSEEYYSTSKHGVLRGLHFQIPPYDHTKMVYCVLGRILDVVVDLRGGSPTFGHFEMFELSAEQANIVYISKGLSHGFYVDSELAIVMYKVTTVYVPTHDSGILWNSVGIPWPNMNPIVSERDKSFVSFSEFKTPFRITL